MTDLHLVGDTHSVRADLAPEQKADLGQITHHVLEPATTAVCDLSQAVRNQDRDLAITAMRRLLALAYFARDYANTLERDPVWQTQP